jgi:hypothetical protein
VTSPGQPAEPTLMTKGKTHIGAGPCGLRASEQLHFKIQKAQGCRAVLTPELVLFSQMRTAKFNMQEDGCRDTRVTAGS